MFFAVASFVINEVKFMCVHDVTKDHFLGIKTFFFGSMLTFCSACLMLIWAKAPCATTRNTTLKTAANKDFMLLNAIFFLKFGAKIRGGRVKKGKSQFENSKKLYRLIETHFFALFFNFFEFPDII